MAKNGIQQKLTLFAKYASKPVKELLLMTMEEWHTLDSLIDAINAHINAYKTLDEDSKKEKEPELIAIKKHIVSLIDKLDIIQNMSVEEIQKVLETAKTETK